MKKSTTTTRRSISSFSLLFIIAAFVAGALIYFFGALAISRLTPSAGAASGGWHEVVVRVGACDCVAKFVPIPALPGDGSQINPYQTDNSSVQIAITVNGKGYVTVEDETGKIVLAYNKTSYNVEEKIATVELPHSLGEHKLIVKINGEISTAEDVSAVMYINLVALPPIIPNLPGVPSTGSYLYIAGYAVETYSLLIAGAIGAIIAGIVICFKRRFAPRKSKKSLRIPVHRKKPSRKPAPKRRPVKRPKRG
jgi:hypothetical protein